GHEVAAAMAMGEAAARVVARPGLGLQRQQIMAEIDMDRDALAGGPIVVGLDQEPVLHAVGGGGEIVRHRRVLTRLGSGRGEWTRSAAEAKRGKASPRASRLLASATRLALCRRR